MSDLIGTQIVGFLTHRLKYYHEPILSCSAVATLPQECLFINEPRREKTGLRGFRTGPTQTGLYKLRKELEA